MMDFLKNYNFQSDQILSRLADNEQTMVAEKMKSLAFKKGQLLFHEEGIPTGIYLLKEGKAKIYKTGFNGKEQIFYIYNGGDLLGYHQILCNENYSESCEAIENCKVSFINKDDFEELLMKIPHLKELFLQNMSHEFGVMVNTIMLMAKKPLRERLALYLLKLSQKYTQERGICMSREDLANIVGASRESLTRQLHDFKEEKLIEIEGRTIILKNNDKLISLAVL